MQKQYEKPLVLIGLMGAGKSSVGKRLADALGWRFIDMDDEIVAAANCSIEDIFFLHGEAVFRDLELRVAKRLLAENEQPAVIATGGGAWMQPEIRALIQQQANSVWLRASIGVLFKRLEKNTTRPLLQKGDKREILQKLIDTRYPIYEQADIIVDSTQGTQANVAQKIIQSLRDEK